MTDTKSTSSTTTSSATETFRPLEKEYNKYGYHFKEVHREGIVAIYSQVNEDTPDAEPTSYEVFIIKQMPAGFVGPRKYPQPAREIPPSSEEWGRLAFTYWTLEDAMKKFKELQERVNSRQ